MKFAKLCKYTVDRYGNIESNSEEELFLRLDHITAVRQYRSENTTIINTMDGGCFIVKGSVKEIMSIIEEGLK